MDGLEISEINYSKVIDVENSTFRFDSEYFKKKYLKFIKLLKDKNSVELSTKFIVSGGKRLPLNTSFSNSGYKYARAEDIKRSFLDIEKSPYISFETHDLLKKYITKKEDVLLTIVGNSIGDIAINKQTEIINLTENCVRIYSEDKKPGFIYCFLKSKYGQFQIEREKVGTAQPKLAIERIRKFLIITSFSEKFINTIDEYINASWNCILESRLSYKNAEALLINKLNINVFEEKNISVKMKSLSLDLSGRLDAEYYLPKYDILYDGLKAHNTRYLGGERGLVNINKSIEPGSELYQEEGVPFVRVSDIDKFEMSQPYIRIPKDIFPNIDRLYPKKDTILFSKDGSIGIAYKVQENLNVITSGALLHLTVKNTNEILPDYLTLVLNSPVVKLQAERDCNGAIIQHWKPSNIENVIIPIINMSDQIVIAEKVCQSFRTREKSKKLLDYAIKAVEMAIELDEDSALLWLELQE